MRVQKGLDLYLGASPENVLSSSFGSVTVGQFPSHVCLGYFFSVRRARLKSPVQRGAHIVGGQSLPLACVAQAENGAIGVDPFFDRDVAHLP